MAAALAPDKIGGSCVVPVIGETARHAREPGEAAATIPLGRVSQLPDVASAYLYLASDDTAFVTGWWCRSMAGGRSDSQSALADG